MSEFEDLFGEWGARSDGTPNVVEIETYKGAGRDGAIYLPPVTVEGLPVMTQNRLVQNSDGSSVTSSTRVSIDGDHEHAAAFTLHSRIRVNGGRQTIVVQLREPDAFGLFGFRMVDLA